MTYQTMKVLNGWPLALFLLLSFIVWCYSIYRLMSLTTSLSKTQRFIMLIISIGIQYGILSLEFFIDFSLVDLFTYLPISEDVIFSIDATAIFSFMMCYFSYALSIAIVWIIVRLFYREISWPVIMWLSLSIAAGFVFTCAPFLLLVLIILS